MDIQFNLDLINNKVDVTFKGAMTELNMNTPQFILNRDFVVNELKCDSNKIDIAKIKTQIAIENYVANKYVLPVETDCIQIKYTGILDGTTGLCPYVREKINKEFTFLRWETFCYPIFADDNIDDILEFIQNEAKISIRLVVPKEYSVLSSSELLDNQYSGDECTYIFKSNNMELYFAIAKYNRVKLTTGDFYLLNNISESDTDKIAETLSKAHNFMNEHFGKRDISSTVKYVCIPKGLGSFATESCVYIEEDIILSQQNRGNIIHEFIHLGWNARTDNETQRIRFFDEAFTCYFTLRTLEHILTEENFNKQLDVFISSVSTKINADLRPISEYGNYGLGDLSYTIGALCLYELCETVGKEIFDYATKVFLNKYKEVPVNLEQFCQEYISLCDCNRLKEFFSDWIYTTKGPKDFIRT